MGLSEYCKLKGFESAVELSALCQIPTSTLQDWYKTGTDKLEVLVSGATQKRTADHLIELQKKNIYEHNALNSIGSRFPK